MKIFNQNLIKAAKDGDDVKIKAMLSLPRFNPMSKDKEGWTALMYAAEYGHASCVKIPIPVSDPLFKSKEGWTALIRASQNGHASCADILILASDPLNVPTQLFMVGASPPYATFDLNYFKDEEIETMHLGHDALKVHHA